MSVTCIHGKSSWCEECSPITTSGGGELVVVMAPSDPNEPFTIHIDSLPGGTSYAMGEEHAKKTVREWHPKCETCRWFRGLSPDGGECDMLGEDVSRNWYCAEHTALNLPTEDQP
jgi:hypothetical protein